MSRLYKAKYFLNSHILHAKASPGSSFIWKGIITAKNEIMQGCMWILGDGESIKCTQNLWLVWKDNFRVDLFVTYADSNMVVSQLFLPYVRA